ncbi:MAG: 3-deoxy-D-manno-octulosonic acid transferase [Holosporales bacterium]
MRASLFSPYWLLSQTFGPLWARRSLERRALLGKEDALRLHERKGISEQPRPDGFVAWLHGASVGESLSLLPLMAALSKEYPRLQFLVTTGTRAAAEVIKNRLPKNAIHQFAPLDVPSWIERFLNHWQPDLALWAESELWPNMVFETFERGIPLILINARMSDRSFKRWRLFKPWARALLSSFDLCLAQSEEAAQRLRTLGAEEVVPLGNLKLLAPPLAYDQVALSTFKTQLNDRPRWLAASTHEGEEAVVAECHLHLRRLYPSLVTLIAPRHPLRVPALVEQLAAHNLRIQLRSLGEAIRKDTDIYIVDTLGEMGLFFSVSSCVFLGGSLVPIGGHNLIEPAQLHCAILHGPHMHKTRDLRDLFRHHNAALEVADAAQLIENLAQLLGDEALRLTYAKRAGEVVAGHQHILDRVLASLAPYLEKAKA